ncbi:NUDIX hydrolase [Streptomyces gibsoniae]|uniref:NUDIX domain-containing protein n=1 Tax=Streptomyces gibsoniae TaxID=3075529 RepID=A0ABU2U1Z2_9ACTN|nr:NUDIX domain-containing protein [Streptomyces sp. DSM 41699]MDT0467242.1 NUDIX domain-containing protein [Streptomyces sp. DSM 41699]
MIEKVAWVRLDEGRLLAARTHGRDLFHLPGGKPETGETPGQTLVREIREELGVTLDPATVVPLLITEAPTDGNPASALVRTTCFTADHTGTPAPCGEVAEIACLTHSDHPRAGATTRDVLDRLAVAGRLLLR